MVRLYYLAVVQKSEKNTVLSESSDLSDFNFFKRSSTKEFMRFSSLLMVGRTDPGCKVSVREQIYVCHVYVRPDHLAAAAVTDDEYPNTEVHKCLQDLLVDFDRRRQSDGQYSGTKELMDRYSKVARNTDGLARIQGQLDETAIVLHQTMESVLRRGENLDDLVAKAEELSVQAKTFYKTAKKTNSCCQAF